MYIQRVSFDEGGRTGEDARQSEAVPVQKSIAIGGCGSQQPVPVLSRWKYHSIAALP